MNVKNLPRLKDKALYREYERQFVELALSYPDVTAVYTAGTVKNPGISDLDFLVCLQDTMSGRFDIEDHLNANIKAAIGSGSILKVNEANIQDVKIIDDFPLMHVGGKRYDFTEYASWPYEVCRILDWLPERFSTLVRIRQADDLDATWALQVVKSLGVSLQKLAKLTGSRSYETFLEEVVRTRQQWFSIPDDTSHLHLLLDQAVSAGKEALTEIDTWLTTQGIVKVDDACRQTDTCFAIRGGPSFVFGDHVAVVNGRVQVPYTVMIFLWAQALASDQFVSRHVKLAFNQPVRVNPLRYMHSSLYTVIHRRMEYIERLVHFYQHHGLQRGLLKYGWFLV